MLEAIHGHTLDTDLLNFRCTVLDVGCRGFQFGNELRMRFEAYVYEVDIDDLKTAKPYCRCGIASFDGSAEISAEIDPEARHLLSGKGDRVQVYTIASFSKLVQVNHWDAVKLDCEGSEYDILWNWPGPIATQISVEFHEHTFAKRGHGFINQLVKRLEQWYDVRQHNFYGKKPEFKNYWDSLFVLRDNAK